MKESNNDQQTSKLKKNYKTGRKDMNKYKIDEGGGWTKKDSVLRFPLRVTKHEHIAKVAVFHLL